MSKKTVVPFKVPRLVRVIAEEITDPAERAALDKLRKRRKRKPPRQESLIYAPIEVRQ